MTPNTILDEAEKRITHVIADGQAEQRRIVALMQQEIGHDLYQRAKRAWPEIERETQRTYLPFTRRVLAMAERAARPLPSSLQTWITAIQQTCHVESIAEGVNAFESLSAQQVLDVDGRTINQHERAIVIQ